MLVRLAVLGEVGVHGGRGGGCRGCRGGCYGDFFKLLVGMEIILIAMEMVF